MPIISNSPDGLTLRKGTPWMLDFVKARYGAEPRINGDPSNDNKPIGGCIYLLMVEGQQATATPGVGVVGSAGFAQIPFENEPPQEVVCETLAGQEGAGIVAVSRVVRRAIEELTEPWTDGRVWMNDEPLLSGTRIRAIVVGPSLRGADYDAWREADGSPTRVRTAYFLTEAEARAVATRGWRVLEQAWREHGTRLLDVTRTDDLIAPEAPDAEREQRAPVAASSGERSSEYPAPEAVAAGQAVGPAKRGLQSSRGEPLAPPSSTAAAPGPGTGPRRDDARMVEPMLAVKWLNAHHARWIECDERGRFKAYTQLEKPAELQNQDNYELWTLDRFVSLNPWLDEFVRTARAGDYASYGEPGGWRVGRLEDL